MATVCSEWARLRHTRGGRDLAEVAHAAGVSPETLRKIETGPLPSPGFGTIICLGAALNLPVQELAATWRGSDLPLETVS
jgi:DNA-binding XRE family transcriptional regulator